MRKIIIRVIIIMISILAIIISYNINRNANEVEEVQVATIPIEENIIDEEENLEDKKPIDSNTSDWNLILINRNNAIPENYEIETTKIEKKWNINVKIKEATELMLADARKEGLKPVICSAYRTYAYQKNLFNKKVKEYRRNGYSQQNAEQEASFWVAIPGTSEHEVGLALDIVSENYQILDENQENTPVQKWLMEHCYEYGFILRYPTSKKNITNINYEPWHYRYVGVKDAMFMKEKGFCLEEYIEFLKQYEK